VAKLFGDRLYLRGAWIHTDKDQRTDAGRSAVSDGLSMDAFLFLDGPSRYLALGYLVADEDAARDGFDYDGRRFRLLYTQRLEWMSIELKSRLQLEHRDYAQLVDEPLPENGTTRRADDRLRARFSLDLPVNEWFTVESGIEYARNASNLETADFDEVGYSVRLAAAF
ncbi:MAG TPA: hypothetical protein VE175_13975, partial [Woeseiaceae bacterium]|nr:hypothetical protein [Woeseiaceae bacterium]